MDFSTANFELSQCLNVQQISITDSSGENILHIARFSRILFPKLREFA